MRLILNENTSPEFNLALEEYALTQMEEEVIILWRNRAAVIVGANQNSLEEIDIDYIKEHDIPVIRRMSGGGAVFHDLGNINFTVIQRVKDGDFNNYAKFTAPICEYLNALGVKAQLQGRNDLVIDGMKFCGNAQAVKKGRIMHHGCVLYSADLSRLAGALKPRGVKIESKGIKSVRKRVTNIIDHMQKKLPVEEFLSGLCSYFLENTSGVTLYTLNDNEKKAVLKLVEEKYSKWEWNFGKSPSYNFSNYRKYDFGIVEVKLMVKNGVIEDVSIFGDFFGINSKEELESKIRGLRHQRGAIEASLKEVDIGRHIAGMDLGELLELVC